MFRIPLAGSPGRAAAFALAALLVAPPLQADPPAHAPAHGWRKKHDPDYQGYSGRKWKSDYGILQGTCNRQAIGAVVGAAIGGAVGSQVGGGDGRSVATIVGTIIGAAIGAKIGRDMDQADRACVAHAIELGRPGSRVTWTNATTGVSYVLTPVRDVKRDGRTCREYDLTLDRGGRSEQSRGTACRTGDGTWQIAN